MKKFQAFLILFLLFSCINKSEERKIEKREGMGKEVQQSKETKYMNLEDFNKKYSYLNQNEAEIQSENRVLVRYIQEKEKKLEKILEFDQEYIDTDIAKILKNFSTDEEKIIQMIKLIIEFEKNSNNSYFFESILSEEIKYGKKQVLKEFNKTEDKESILLPILEKNFTEEEIRIFFDLYYKNIEFDNYEIAGRYGLKKVDKVIEEVEKIEGLSEEEWGEREMKIDSPLFKNEYKKFSNVHILKDNRIIIVDENQKPIKEIKVKDYRKIDLTIYKGILYIYDDGKIYEYSTKNLDDVKVIDVKNL
ncbi:hypothetical protein HMPREF1984_02064 [Leptotrichia sp. oral taxon 215 str. W9775]|jgi:hypothetical protein|uniref:hypothetical protein n=1 Tax=Leptotrichia sp. oral taxon 215 TaxID=712359 RepID=UPI0003AE6BE2|nr:hypothetical protein [Leptotrichia sp. oral taxon 215]ERK65798.1 hypothetical protein HMPREF1984_02064 [Leptotrichia sp. oral taxon 215 str. W9775]